MGDYDLTAMAHFLTFLWVPSPRTPFTGARSIGPGECLRHNASGYHVARYCDPSCRRARRHRSPSRTPSALAVSFSAKLHTGNCSATCRSASWHREE